MFNRSWYKNTWLGKKLGFKIDWNTENLVKSDGTKIEVLFTIEDSMYFGCIKETGAITSQITRWSNDLDLEEYKIEYDPTKLKATEHIEQLIGESDEDSIVIVTLGLDDKYKDYRMCTEFYESTGRFILEEYPIVKNYWGEYEISFRCKEVHASGVRTLAKAFINDKS